MIKKLQIKFVALAMASLFIVLAVIMTGINIVNYRGIVREADEVLELLSRNKGAFPKGEGPRGMPLPHDMSPELPYETRFFSVLLDDAGGIIQAETGNIAAVGTEDAVNFAIKIAEGDCSKGFLDNYRYIRYTEGKLSRVIFLDCGRKLDAFKNFLFASCAISLGGIIAAFLLITFFSARIVRPIAESYEKQKRFITDAGHEIKTPLTIINADIGVLQMEIGENEWLEDIERQSKRLAALTDDLIYLARMEETEKVMQMIEFPLSDVVEETAGSFQMLAQSQDKEFISKVEPMISMKGDERAIQQLIYILLDNALKYSPEHGVVSAALEKNNKTIVLTVFNTTQLQIPCESLEYLFDRFYRGDPSRNSQTGGHGIGLSIAKAIVEAHNGKIQVAARDERSLQITVTFTV